MKINIDIRDLIDNFTLTKEQGMQLSQNIVTAIVKNVEYNWRENASRGLGSTRSLYLKGLIKPTVQNSGNVSIATISLIGSLPNMIEDGCPPFDMKTGFSRSSKVKIGKNGGWFLTIPFRFATPNSLGENEVFAGKIPDNLFKLIKDTEPKKNTKSGIEYGVYRINKQDAPEVKTSKGYGQFEVYEHKSSIFTGLTKIGTGNDSKYMNFRRVSQNSDPNAFIHPGFVAKHFAEKAVQQTNADIIAQNVAANFLESIGF